MLLKQRCNIGDLVKNSFGMGLLLFFEFVDDGVPVVSDGEIDKE